MTSKRVLTFPTFCLLAVLVLFSCKNKNQPVRNTEARDNPVEYQNAETSQSKLSDSVEATLETEPVISTNAADDAADDPRTRYQHQCCRRRCRRPRDLVQYQRTRKEHCFWLKQEKRHPRLRPYRKRIAVCGLR